MIMSFTPNVDAMQQGVEQMRRQMEGDMAAPGADGTIARITFAVAGAAAMAVARERDLHSPPADVVDGICNAVANVISQTARGFWPEHAVGARVLDMVQEVRHMLGPVAAGQDVPGHEVRVAVSKMGRA